MCHGIKLSVCLQGTGFKCFFVCSFSLYLTNNKKAKQALNIQPVIKSYGDGDLYTFTVVL